MVLTLAQHNCTASSTITKLHLPHLYPLLDLDVYDDMEYDDVGTVARVIESD